MPETPGDRIRETYTSAQFAPMHDLSDAGFAQYDRIYSAAFGPHLPQDRSARIVDIGCGTGQFLHYLHSAGYTNAVGIDTSAGQLGICRRHTPFTTEQADAFEYLAAHPGEAQVVVANHLIEHLCKDDAVELCRLALTALSGGGLFIATTPNMSSILAGRMFHADLTHATGFTEDSLRHCLMAGGFDGVRITDGGVPVSCAGKLRAWAESLLHRVVYRVCSQPVPTVCSCSLMAIGRK